MTETVGRRGRRKEDEATAPFVLDRSSVRPPPPAASESAERESLRDDAAIASPVASPVAGHALEAALVDGTASGEHDEHDGVVDLVSRRSVPSEQPVRTSAPADTRRLDRAGRRASRWLAWALVVDAAVLLTLAFTSLSRLLDGAAGAPDLLIGSVTFVLALPCLLAARHLGGIGRRSTTRVHDAHGFAQGIGHLRAIFMLKAFVLASTLGLGCLAFSLIASLLAEL